MEPGWVWFWYNFGEDPVLFLELPASIRGPATSTVLPEAAWTG